MAGLSEEGFIARLTFGLALVDPPLPIEIPTLSPWALLAMVALLPMTGVSAADKGERRRGRWMISGAVVALGALALAVSAAAGVPSNSVEVRAQLAGVRVPFIANQGQVDARVAYYAPTFAGTLFVTQQGELVYALSGPRTDAKREGTRPASSPGWSLTETLIGGRARPLGQDRSVAGVSTFIGSDPARWRSALPAYDQISLGEVWPGVSVALRARGPSIEKIFTVHPAGSAGRIRVRVAGAQALSVNGEGALIASTGLGAVTFTAPIAYQERDGVRRPVAVAYRRQGVEYGFNVGAYDPDLPLVIDPLLQSTYLGGFGPDGANAIAIHPTTGDVYVAGDASSSPFPGTAGGAQPAFAGISDAFVARFPRTLTSLTQAAYLGGLDIDSANALAIDPPTGDVYVAGFTLSFNFPGTAGGAQPTVVGVGEAFIARLPRTLTSLTQATYLGGAGFDRANAMSIHPATGDVYVAGVTDSGNFPGTAGSAQPAHGGGFTDAFVARLPRTLTSLTRATYLGGSGVDRATALVVEAATSDVFVAGVTDSSNFPGTAGGAQPAFGGGFSGDAFVARLPGTLTSLTRATYLGGSEGDGALALAIHPATGDVYVAGGTYSTNFPGTAGGAHAFGGFEDVFVARLPRTLTSVTQATYLGGIIDERAYALAIHPATGDVYAAGYTRSRDFPGTAGGVQSAHNLTSPDDAFIARLSSTLTALIQATYLGGSGFDMASALAIHPLTGDVYVAGLTEAADFPGTAGGAQPTIGSTFLDAFVARLTFSLAQVDPVVAIPTLSPWALLAMAVLLLMTGVVAVRRRWAR
jgi:hypothetical protein